MEDGDDTEWAKEYIVDSKTPNDKSKILVNGYIRNILKDVFKDKVIDETIYATILRFYYLCDYFEKFNKEIYKNTIGDGVIKCIDKHKYSTIYGNLSISMNEEYNKNCKYIWTFRINKIIENCIWFGISSTYIIDQDCFCNRESSNYCIGLDGEAWSKCDRKRYVVEGYKFNKGDIIKMIINFKLKQISYFKNNENLGVIWDNIDINNNIKYKMAVILGSPQVIGGNEIALIDFQCVYVNNNNNNNDDVGGDNDGNDIINSLKEENMKLLNKVKEITKQMDICRSDMDKEREEKLRVREEMGKLLEKISELRKTIKEKDSLIEVIQLLNKQKQTEFDELVSEIAKLKQENQSLKQNK